MPIRVHKYGGSSVADVPKIEAVAEKIVAAKEEGHEVVAVVSAMGGQTDALLALAKQITSSPPRRELDMLLTTGERVTMALLSMAIHKRGHDAISFTGSQCGIITNDRHFDAKIIDVRAHRVEDELARGKIVIVAGYQGMSYKREITTLGRGGSDTTALALAAALGAERAEIYSDVDGIYSADPRKVPGAEHLPRISYSDMQAMADAGAKVLHAEAVEFARKAGIAIHARSTFKPGRETIISSEGDERDNAVSCASAADVIEVEIEASKLADVSNVLSKANLNATHVGVEGARAWLALRRLQCPNLEAVKEPLAELGAMLVEGLGSASVIGDAVGTSTSVVGETQAALHAEGVSPRRVQQSRNTLSVTVQEADVDRAVGVLHRRFIEAPS